MEQETETNGKLDTWDKYIAGDFLKAANVNDEKEGYGVVEVQEVEENEEVRVRLFVERKGIEWKFDLNKTNAIKLKELGIKSPREMVGTIIFFKKVLTRNPQTKQEVEGLRISQVVPKELQG